MRSTLFTLVTPLLFSLAISAAPQRASISPGFPYGSQKVRGVNLGGWLLLEPWITPNLFDETGNEGIVDEWTFCQYQDRNVARSKLQQHWDTWITEDDFRQIAAAGLNHVRLPIGFWAWDVSGGEPYIQGQLPYLDRAVSWARNHGLKLIIDLHGAPGSQNGYDNSGHRQDAPGWQNSQSNIDRTNAIIKTLAAQFADQYDVVSMIGALNEPAGWYGQRVLDVTRQYWYDSYGNIRYPYGTSRQGNTVLMISDAFQELSYWAGFMSPPNWEGVAMDTHFYQMFTIDRISRSEDEQIAAACNEAGKLSSFHLWTIVGEWTPTGDDCAKYLNGRGRGTRYEGTLSGSYYIGSCRGRTGDASQFSESRKAFLRRYWEAQTIAFEKGAGWIQWTWKAAAEEWSYQAGLRYGWIPRNPDNRQYPNICG